MSEPKDELIEIRVISPNTSGANNSTLTHHENTSNEIQNREEMPGGVPNNTEQDRKKAFHRRVEELTEGLAGSTWEEEAILHRELTPRFNNTKAKEQNLSTHPEATVDSKEEAPTVHPLNPSKEKKGKKPGKCIIL